MQIWMGDSAPGASDAGARAGRIGIGLIGSGFMGRCHAYAFSAAPAIFDVPEPVLAVLADVDQAAAEQAAAALGFARGTGDWHDLIADPAVDVVDITAPNGLHKEIALAAVAAGKAIYCEKPLAPTTVDAKAMVDAAEAAGIKTQVGFNYVKNPVAATAKEIIEAGEIGEVIGFRGAHFEDFMGDPAAPYTWRFEPEGGDGVIGDLGSHVISMARYLLGDIEAVFGDKDTVIKERPAAPGGREMRPVHVADQVRVLTRFANGARGTIEASWIATGRKMTIAVEVTGTKGAILFDFERLNELRLYTAGQPRGRDGFKTILTGPEHAHYARFTPAPGHQLGFNELKIIEVATMLQALAAGGSPWPDFREAWQVQRVVDAVIRSADEGHWVAIDH